jgi:hypothetical protein
LTLDPLEIERSGLDNRQSQIWTSIIGIIQSVDYTKITCSVIPAVQGYNYQPDKSGTLRRNNVNYPLLVDIPIHFLGSANTLITTPIKAGDECTINFLARNCDAWQQNGSFKDGKTTPQPQLLAVMHDYSDCYVSPGIKSSPSASLVTGGISQTDVQLRTSDGEVVIGFNETTKVITIHTNASINIVSTSNTNITAPLTNITGDCKISGTLTIGSDNLVVNTHGHPYLPGPGPIADSEGPVNL